MTKDINFTKKDRVEEEIRFCEYTKKELETVTLPAIRRKIRFYKNMLKKIQKEENEETKNNNRK